MRVRLRPDILLFRQADYLRVLSGQELGLLHELHGPVVAAESSGTISYVSPDAAKVLGWTSEELAGKPLVALMPDRMRDRHRRAFASYLATGKSRLMGKRVAVPALRKDGSEVTVELMLRVFRRPGGTQLIVAFLKTPEFDLDPAAELVKLETGLQRRAYHLV